ncbi:MAG: PIN domain-containing protein [Deltaproteobacteria bacterium]|nr:PIN domain-containing protein [Deltaproteobacteria bacterium]
MTTAYVDSSFFLGIAFDEARGSHLRDVLARYERLVSCDLLIAECLSAALRESVDDDVILEALRGIALVLPFRSLASEMRSTLEKGHLRGADLWHLACALFVAEDETDRVAFLTRDVSQRRIARRLGFPTP